MWNFKKNIQNSILKTQDATGNKLNASTQNINQKSTQKKEKTAASDARKKSTDHYYEIKNKLFNEIINELNLEAVQSTKEEKNIRNAISDLVNSLCIKYQYATNDAERKKLSIDIQNDILGLGPLEKLLSDEEVSEIMVNKSDTIYVEKKGKIILTEDRFSDDKHLLKIINKIVSKVGRRIDELNPMVDARLEDGSRFNAIIPPIAIDGPAISIRKFSVIPLQMDDLLNKNTLTKKMADLLSALVQVKANIIISGGTGSGKTTLLNILSGYIPHGERIITIEDTAELQMQQDHVIRLESRPANTEGKGEITFRDCVKNSLRMRPDRIVLGEIRGEEIIDMFQAMNTGHEGSLSTIHANSPREALQRMENLMSMGGVSFGSKNIREQISNAIDIVIQIARLNDGTRKIVSIHEITGMEGDVITSQEIFRFNRTATSDDGEIYGNFEATGIRPNIADKIKTYGIKLEKDIFSEKFGS
jgi:pilus assembly protein CpaF